MDQAKGNPRNTIKAIRNKLDDVIEDRLQDPDRFPIPPEPKDDLSIDQSSALLTPQLTAEQLEILENVTIDINPSSIIAAISSNLKQNFPQGGCSENVEFTFKNKLRFLALLFTNSEYKIGIEVPSVKSFDKRGGVAAYYALSRLTEAKSEGVIDTGILIVPAGTSGKKYQSALQSAEHFVKIIEFNQVQAEALIKHGLIKLISPKGQEIVEIVKALL